MNFDRHHHKDSNFISVTEAVQEDHSIYKQNHTIFEAASMLSLLTVIRFRESDHNKVVNKVDDEDSLSVNAKTFCCSSGTDMLDFE